jgi:hypothetical protein
MKFNTRMIAGAIQINWKTAQDTGMDSEWYRVTTLLQGIWLLAFESGCSSDTLSDITCLQHLAYEHVGGL